MTIGNYGLGSMATVTNVSNANYVALFKHVCLSLLDACNWPSQTSQVTLDMIATGPCTSPRISLTYITSPSPIITRQKSPDA